jgi:hypothetical protein
MSLQSAPLLALAVLTCIINQPEMPHSPLGLTFRCLQYIKQIFSYHHRTRYIDTRLLTTLRIVSTLCKLALY